MAKAKKYAVTQAAPKSAKPDTGPATLPGRDHRSLLLFLQTVEANNGGDVRSADTRGCPAGYPGRMRNKTARCSELPWSEKFGTRFDDGTIKGDHDDYDCLWELDEWGFIETTGTGLHPIVKLTDKGHSYVSELIRQRGQQAQKARRVEEPSAVD